MNGKTLSCKDLGNNTCDFVARGDSDDDVKRRMIDHATRVHPDHRYGPDWEGALGREIDDILKDRAPVPAEDASQGGEFLDDRIARDEKRGRAHDTGGLTPLEGEADEYVGNARRRS